MNNELKRQQRGWIEKEQLLSYTGKDTSEVITLLREGQPMERTIAAHLLTLDSDTTNILLDSLSHETALYTRLAIAEKLESGDQSTAQKMIPYLGSIGTNQHNSPIRPSQKKSFPLPRDLIARSLGRMKPNVFSTLMGNTEQIPILMLRELIDAIGYMAFYHPEVATDENYQRLLHIKNIHVNLPLIHWKFLICFSAFPQSKELLQKEGRFVAEAQRSLAVLEAK